MLSHGENAERRSTKNEVLSCIQNTIGLDYYDLGCWVRKGVAFVFLCNLLQFVGSMEVELKEGEEGLVVDLHEEEAMESSNTRIEPSRVKEEVRNVKVAWTYLKEGCFTLFMESIKGRDDKVTWK